MFSPVLLPPSIVLAIFPPTSKLWQLLCKDKEHDCFHQQGSCQQTCTCLSVITRVPLHQVSWYLALPVVFKLWIVRIVFPHTTSITTRVRDVVAYYTESIDIGILSSRKAHLNKHQKQALTPVFHISNNLRNSQRKPLHFIHATHRKHSADQKCSPAFSDFTHVCQMTDIPRG